MMKRLYQHHGWFTQTSLSLNDVWIEIARVTWFQRSTRRISLQAVDSVDTRYRLHPLLFTIALVITLGGIRVMVESAGGAYGEEKRNAGIILGAALTMLGILVGILAVQHVLLIRSMSGKSIPIPFGQTDDRVAEVSMEVEDAIRQLWEQKAPKLDEDEG